MIFLDSSCKKVPLITPFQGTLLLPAYGRAVVLLKPGFFWNKKKLKIWFPNFQKKNAQFCIHIMPGRKILGRADAKGLKNIRKFFPVFWKSKRSELEMFHAECDTCITNLRSEKTDECRVVSLPGEGSGTITTAIPKPASSR